MLIVKLLVHHVTSRFKRLLVGAINGMKRVKYVAGMPLQYTGITSMYIGVDRECWLSFGAEYFVFLFAIQKCKE